MAKNVRVAVDLPHSPEDAFAQQCDAGYQKWKLEQMFGSNVNVSVTPSADGGATIVHSRDLPAEVPSLAKKFVGDAIRVTETHVWGPASGDGSRSGKLSAEIAGAPMSIAGTLQLSPSGETTSLEVAASVKASIPMVGGKLEDIVADILSKAVHKESELSGKYEG